jgi:hypothetical protein
VAESLIRPTRKHIFETIKMSRLLNPGDGRITRLKAALERGDDTTVWRGHTAPRVQPVPSTTPEDPHLVDGSQNFLARKEMFDVLSSGLTTQHRQRWSHMRDHTIGRAATATAGLKRSLLYGAYLADPS